MQADTKPSEAELIELTRNFMKKALGPIDEEHANQISDEFVFRGPRACCPVLFAVSWPVVYCVALDYNVVAPPHAPDRVQIRGTTACTVTMSTPAASLHQFKQPQAQT